MEITVICRECAGYTEPLLYTVTVPNLDYNTIFDAVLAERRKDCGDDYNPGDHGFEIYVAFKGDPEVVIDFRE